MKKNVLNISLILLLASTGSVFAQQGFGTNRPAQSAAVDIVSPNKGLLIPRMDLTWETNVINAPIASPAQGLLVYNKTAVTNVPEGFYYFDGTKWVPIGVSVLQDSNTTTISGNGTTSNPYKVEVKNLLGDVTGTVIANKVEKIQNVSVSAATPAAGQVLKAVSGTWTPSTLTGSDISDAKTISATSPVKVNNAASVAGATLKDVSITVDKASNTQLGVVQIGSNINVDTDGVISVDFPDGTVDTNTTTTVSSKTDQTYVTVDQSQTTGLPGDVINTRDYKIGVNKATSTTLGVVMPGTGMSIDTDGKLNVTPVADVLTSLTQDASGIHYKPETGAVQDAKVVSANTANIISVDATDFGAFLKAEDIRANQTTTTVKGTAPISVTPAAANVTGNTEYTISANVATTTTLGVVMPGTGMTVDTDGKLNVTSVPDVVTKIQNTVTGHKIADYTNEANAVVNINETITNLTQDASGITYVKEDGTSATAKVVSANSGNLVATGTDFGAFLEKSTVQSNQVKYEVIDGINTTASLDPSSTTDLQKYKVDVATANARTLGVVREAETNPTVNVTNGELAVNLAYTILSGEVIGPLNNTVVKDDVIDAANLKADAVITEKIANNAVTVNKLPAGATSTTFLRGDGTWATPTDNNTDNQTLGLTANELTLERGGSVNLNSVSLAGEVTGPLNATIVADDVIDAANLKTDAVVTTKIANANVTPVKIQPATTFTQTQVMVTGTDGAVKWVDQSTISPATTVSNTSPDNTLITTVNGVPSTSVDLVKTVGLSLTGSNLTATVNGVSNITALDLSSIDTDKQQISYNAATRMLSLERGGDPVDLSALATDNNTITTVTANAAQPYVSVTSNPITPGATANREYTVGVNAATAQVGTTAGTSGVVKPGAQFKVETDGHLSVKYAMPQFFYMPSILIDTSVVDTNVTHTVNLYTQYTTQFNVTDTAMRSNGAPAQIPVLPAATDLHYYVTYSDPNSIEITGITDAGVMSYIVKGNTNSLSFVNIVFVIK